MLTGISKKIELAANVAIVVVACLLATILIKNYFVSRHANQGNKSESQSVTSPTVSALNIDWRQSKQTLLLAVSSTCHFCTESAPFYQQIAKKRGRTRFIAVLPQPISEGKKYLEILGVTVDDIRQAPLNSLNVQGTPTLMLVNSDGVVINTWIGKLAEEEQDEILNKIL